jgi:hypothetical protein
MIKIIDEDNFKCITIYPKGHYMDFEVHEVALSVPDNTPLYFDSKGDYVNIEDATPYLKGSVKWDGCCNYEYPGDCLLHRCGLKGFEVDYLVMKRIYAEAAKYMPESKEYLT